MSEKIKYFHELTEEEFEKLQKTGMTWGECGKKYPQPEWCSYPEAVMGVMGCWSLMYFRVKDKESCGKCECVIGSAFNKEQLELGACDY